MPMLRQTLFRDSKPLLDIYLSFKNDTAEPKGDLTGSASVNIQFHQRNPVFSFEIKQNKMSEHFFLAQKNRNF